MKKNRRLAEKPEKKTPQNGDQGREAEPGHPGKGKRTAGEKKVWRRKGTRVGRNEKILMDRSGEDGESNYREESKKKVELSTGGAPEGGKKSISSDTGRFEGERTSLPLNRVPRKNAPVLSTNFAAEKRGRRGNQC